MLPRSQGFRQRNHKTPVDFKPLDYADDEATTTKPSGQARTALRDIIIKSWPRAGFPNDLAGFIADPQGSTPEKGVHGIAWPELLVIYKARRASPSGLPGATRLVFEKHIPSPKALKHSTAACRKIFEVAPGGWQKKRRHGLTGQSLAYDPNR